MNPLILAMPSPIVRLSLGISVVIAFLGCNLPGDVPSTAATATISASEGSTVLLISIDGFMPEYLAHHETPNLDRLIAEGTSTPALIPVFPTKTFPNHYSIVTGLHPSEHGIIANNMFDGDLDATFSLSNRDAVTDARWWGGEPIWVTAEKQGLTTATLFWPGSEAPIKGVRPTHWFDYDGRLPNEDRVATVLDWLNLPPAERPRFITLYFSHVDTQGHRHGPESAEVADAVLEADQLIGQLLDGLSDLQLIDSVNVIIVSDHGMAATSSDRVVILDDYLDPTTLQIRDHSPVLMAEPVGISVAEALDALRAAPNLSVFHRDSVPAEWHFSDHHRIPSIIAVADEGWEIATRAFYDRDPSRFNGGTHGYPPETPSMASLFLARGPAFEAGRSIEPFSSIHLYNVMAAILGIVPAENSGDADFGSTLLTSTRTSDPSR